MITKHLLNEHHVLSLGKELAHIWGPRGGMDRPQEQFEACYYEDHSNRQSFPLIDLCALARVHTNGGSKRGQKTIIHV